MKRFLLTILTLMLLTASSLAAEEKLSIGVSLHAYYSWAKTIVGDRAEVVPIIAEGADPHSYQPRPEDIQKITELDAIVINGMGHDDYIKPMIKAAGNQNLVVIDPHKDVPLMPSHQKIYDFEKSDREQKISYNSHTYIAINGAVQQIYNITNALAKLSPGNSDRFRQNARSYSKSLRKMLAAALQKINANKSDSLRIATVHDGYAYLLSELGIEVTAVIQPRHGIEPSPRQLQDTIKRIQRANVNVLLGELDYQKKYVDIIYQETGCRIYQLSHVSNGPYTKEKFALDMKKNLDTIVQAVASGN